MSIVPEHVRSRLVLVPFEGPVPSSATHVLAQLVPGYGAHFQGRTSGCRVFLVLQGELKGLNRGGNHHFRKWCTQAAHQVHYGVLEKEQGCYYSIFQQIEQIYKVLYLFVETKAFVLVKEYDTF